MSEYTYIVGHPCLVFNIPSNAISKFHGYSVIVPKLDSTLHYKMHYR